LPAHFLYEKGYDDVVGEGSSKDEHLKNLAVMQKPLFTKSFCQHPA
jgi:hypothetical protein